MQRDLTSAQATLQGLLKSLPADGGDANALATAKLDTCADRLQGLKRKVGNLGALSING